MTSKRCHRGLPQKALLGPGFAVLNPWAQILEAQPLVGSGFAVLEPGFAMEKLPHETLGANPRSPTSSGLSTRSGSAVAKPGFAVEKLPRETFGANPRSLVCHCKRQPYCKKAPKMDRWPLERKNAPDESFLDLYIITF